MNEIAKRIKASFFIHNIVYVLVLGFMLRIALAFFGTLQLDHGTYIAWSRILVEGGFSNFYNSWSDYLPGYLYVLWFLGKINLLSLIPQEILFKLPAIIADTLTSLLIYKILGGKKGFFGAIIYLFNPAVFANSALWGQVDGLIPLFSLLAIYFFPKNMVVSAISLAVGTMIKPQVAFLAPLFVLLILKEKISYKKSLIFVFASILLLVLMFLPFNNTGNFFEFVLGRLNLSANQYPYTAVNAFNFWGLFGQWKEDSILFQFGGYLAFLVSFVFFSKKLWKEKDLPYLLATFTFAFSFMFFTRMHERHMLPLFAPLAILAAGKFIYLIPYIGLSVVYLANLFYSYKWISQNYLVSFDPFFVTMFGLLCFVFLVLSFINEKKVEKYVLSIKQFFLKTRRFAPDNFPNLEIGKGKAKILLLLILGFSLATRIYRIEFPQKDYFDEIYHAFTARLVLYGDPRAWEWWNPHPEGFAYEWTHPPFSKLAMAAGMFVFGENSFGWRIPQAVAGVAGIYLVYLVSKMIFKDETVSLLAAFVYSLDGLALTLTRMGMNDGYVVLFILASVYFFLKKNDLVSALFFGLALSSKWSAVWVAPILFAIWLRRNDKFKFTTFASFAVFPILIYLASYFQMFTTGHDLGTWWGMQQQMWWYHTGLNATHPYTSSWWSWPLNLRPVYLYTSEEIGGFVSRIYAIGNPLVFWFGLFSVISGAMYSYFEKNRNIGLVVFSYLVFFVPWAASPRIMFLYHYLPSIPFMCMAIAYILRRGGKKAIFPVLLIFTFVFIYFYPHWAGIEIPLWLDKSYYWLTSWR